MLPVRATLPLLFDRGDFNELITFTRPSTATRINEKGLIEVVPAGEPRFDYDPVTRKLKGLLIEEQRANLIERSEEFDNAVWSKTAGGTGSVPVVTPNDAIAPDGNPTADRIDYDRGAGNTTSDQSVLSQPVSSTSVIDYTGSFFIKAATPSDVGKQIGLRGFASGTYTVVTLTDYWQRFSFVETSAGGTRIIEVTSRGGVGITGSNQVSIHLWGAQIEQGSFPTSYIPTSGSPATRNADVAVIDNVGTPDFDNFYNPQEGTFLIDIDVSSENISRRPFTVSDGGTNNFILAVINNSTLDSSFLIRNGGATEASLTLGTGTSSMKKIISYKHNDVSASLNGGSVVTDDTANIPTVNRLDIGRYVTDSLYLNGHLKRLVYFPKALDNTDLELLTSDLEL